MVTGPERSGGHAAAERIPVLFDTDIGTDIDDALALAYLLAQPRCDLVGVTTVTGEPHLRAALARKICDDFGRREVPVYAGCSHPWLGEQRQGHPPQAGVLSAAEAAADGGSEHAVDFLRRSLAERPGELTIVAVGPLTNLATLFSLAPRAVEQMRALVLMGGWYGFTHAPSRLGETNIWCDPWAAERVFRSAGEKITAVGLDVTRICALSPDDYRLLLTGGRLGTIGRMSEIWFQGRSAVTFHDPLAAALVFEPELCGYMQAEVRVELHDGPAFGATWPTRPEEGPHRIACSVAKELFFDHYWETIGE